MTGWLEASDWKRAQDTVPIACVDVVPVELDREGGLRRVGLIFRETPHQGRRWCVVGGRLWRDESAAEAIARQLHDTLGRDITFSLPADPQPDYVAQYFTASREVGSVDPRQHALTLNFCVGISGNPTAQGEAAGFRWFLPDCLPPGSEFGFGQDRIVNSCLAARFPQFKR